MTETTQPEVQNEAESADITLTLNDLALMANVIQVTTERGAIKANEMQAVGGLYSKLVQFVNANAPQKEEASNETTGELATPEEG